MTTLAWILASTLLMACLAWVGLAVALRSESLHRILPALVARLRGVFAGGGRFPSRSE